MQKKNIQAPDRGQAILWEGRPRKSLEGESRIAKKSDLQK